ncbi:MAG: DALR domain-containing protein, partial [Planctomycetota bacterium]|nr:DALR domain-containing protein [Planctomycetota bacterium]
QGLRDCGRMVDRWCRLREQLEAGIVAGTEVPGPLAQALPAFTEALCDDLNLARAIGVLNEAASRARADGDAGVADPRSASSELEALSRMDLVLGVLDRNQSPAAEPDDDLERIVAERIEARSRAKAEKDWAAADAIRDELTELGIAIKDGPEGTTWSRIIE